MLAVKISITERLTTSNQEMLAHLKKGLCQNGKKYFGFCCDNTAVLFESIFGYSPEIRSQGMECVSLGPGRKKWILGFYPPRI